MSTIDLGSVTQAADFANAIELADKSGKRLLVEKDNSVPGGETTYRLSAESKLSRYIRNVKAFFTGGISGYDHDRRAQLAFRHLIAKAETQQAGSAEADRLSLLDARIGQVDGRAISGSAAKLFAQYIKQSHLEVTPQQLHNPTYGTLPSQLAADYEVPVRGVSAEPDINDYDEISEHDYDYVSNNRSTPNFTSSHYETESRYETQAGWFGVDNGGQDNVYETPIDAQGHKSSVQRDYDYAKAEETRGHDDDNTPPKLGGTQLRTNRPDENTFNDISSDSDFRVPTDAAFREALKFPKHSITQSLIDGSTVSISGTVPVPQYDEDYTPFHLVLAANSVPTKYINRLSIVIDADEFNERLAQALASEDSSSEPVADAELKGTQAADILVAVKLLDELLHEAEQEYVTAVAKEKAEEAQYLKNLEADQAQYLKNLEDERNEEFTPLNLENIEADEEFTPLLRENRASDDSIYASLTDISTDVPND